jgi:hypothetical protein
VRPAIKLAIVWLALAATVVAVTEPFNIPSFLKLVDRGAPATATIVETTCNSHSTASYTFTVGSARYSGSDVVRDCDLLRPGDQIQIYYDVTDPALSRAGDPRVGLTNEIMAIVLGILIFPTFIVGFIVLETRRAKR